MKLNCLIVDDEPLALDVLENYIKKSSQLNLVARCNNAIEAMEKLNKSTIDLVFLDIQMPEITGIEFLKSIKEPPMVVFTTAYQNYALEGFELNAIDFLLKPFSFERFEKAVNKVFEMAELRHDKHSRDDEYIFIKADQKLMRVNYTDILFIEALADYVKIHTHDKRYITLQTMKNMEEKLPEKRFKRVHRSYIVSLDKIKTIVGGNVEVNGSKIPIGKNYKEDFFEAMKKYNVLR